MGPVFREANANEPVGFNTGSHMSLLKVLGAYMYNLILDVNHKLRCCFRLLTACD